MKTITVTFTRRQAALVLRVLLNGAGAASRLAKATDTAAVDLQRMASGDLAPTAGILSYLEFRRSGRNYVWQF
jgi:hypothetical protein